MDTLIMPIVVLSFTVNFIIRIDIIVKLQLQLY